MEQAPAHWLLAAPNDTQAVFAASARAERRRDTQPSHYTQAEDMKRRWLSASLPNFPDEETGAGQWARPCCKVRSWSQAPLLVIVCSATTSPPDW